jgi:heme/copper-type cytochrome/quinol oxidase subunit 3
MATQDVVLDTQEHTSTGVDNVKLAMWAFLGSECLFFGSFISTYLLYRNDVISGPTPHEIYDIPFTSVSSFVLLMSSLTMVLALGAIHRKDERQMRVWLLATAALGMVFIGGQIYEFTTFVEEGMKLDTSTFSSAFFVLTGFHGAHVTGHPLAADPGDDEHVRKVVSGGRAESRDDRALLALRGHRLGRHLHGCLSDPHERLTRSRS